jgi:acetylornithine deacetylase/succinyl-diaminopimelate desuccinylase-like protein
VTVTATRTVTATGAALGYARAHAARHLHDVATLAAIPSVSADPAHRGDVERAARWLVARLRSAGLPEVRLHRTDGHPAVVGYAPAPPGAPTLLVYGHYDVQPAGPSGAWAVAPFRPVVRDGVLYGRGVSDDKGQLMAHVAAVECWYATAGALPVGVVLVLDGEEEIGSPHLGPVLDAVWARYRPSAAVVSDTRMRDARTPALTVSLRGAVHAELIVRGAAGDLHSGAYGGAVADPARELCRIVCGLHSPRGAVRLPGLPPPSPRAVPGEAVPSDAEVLGLGWARPAGAGAVEARFGAHARATVRPALVVSALRTGDGRSRAVVRAEASADLSLRLAPGQDPARAVAALRSRIRRLSRPGTVVSLDIRATAAPVELPTSGTLVDAARAAARIGFGRAPVLLRSGGTIPVVHQLAVVRGLPTVLLGFALAEDRMHAPNERFAVDCFRGGVRTAVALLGASVTGPPAVPG